MESRAALRRCIAKSGAIAGSLVIALAGFGSGRVVHAAEAMNTVAGKKQMFIKQGDTARREVLLTFDDGPHPKSITRILDVLRAKHVKAVFFVVGIRMIQSPAIVRRMVTEGHEVGNHTQDHLRLDTLPPDRVSAEIETCEREFEAITGRHMALLRPPGMRINDAIKSQCEALGYTILGWDVAAKDFVAPRSGPGAVSAAASETLATEPAEIAERVLAHAKNGSIILLHDAPLTALALPAIIDGLRRRGFELCPPREFLAHARAARQRPGRSAPSTSGESSPEAGTIRGPSLP